MGFFTLRPHQLFDTVPKYNVSYVIDLKARHLENKILGGYIINLRDILLRYIPWAIVCMTRKKSSLYLSLCKVLKY